MHPKPLPPVEVLRELLSYNPETGAVEWRVRPQRMSKRRWELNRTAFPNRTQQGYLRGDVAGQTCLAHRVIWKIVHGVEPDLIDHIDGNPSNNRLANLRSVERSTNSKNARLYRSNSSGCPGVFRTREGRWRAYIGHGGKRIELGHYAKIDEAISVRRRAETELGFTARHGVA